MRLSELSLITAGTLYGDDTEFYSVSIDTRSLKPGDLFIAVNGPRFDGHDFVSQAEKLGACGVIVEQRQDSHLPQILVSDARIALGKLGAAWRGKCPVQVVGLTGSNGKTTVKEMISSILSVNAKVLFTRGNLNNDLGVPLTLLGLAPDHLYAVVEMGANHPGEIAYVAGLSSPDVALITNAGEAHLEGFGSREGIAHAKGEIIASLGSDGIAILNADDCFFGFWCELAGSRKVVRFGFGNAADVKGLSDSVRLTWDGDSFKTFFSFEHQGIRHNAALNLAGRHNVANALAAVATCLALGVSFEQIKLGLSRLTPVKGRIQPDRAENGALMINDSYNANPSSFKAALEVLTEMPGQPWVALGAFGELGDASAQLHTNLGTLAKASGVMRLFATGPQADKAVESFGQGGSYFTCLEDMIEKIKEELSQDVALLVKGSRSQHMERVIEALRART
ncbi:MAG: UDP-N-acetylmuramoylalanyl-D-glutamate--2,6-diaminopimelate ligase [Candidatus Methylumidiphilus alinenensis]|uniref:UDP-N-acetylmuramoyl-tripeptide--D-alanyl-D-alanine ligase n=1 Tax=Candidatus Methylumidiphilus alinenensis TaxID=2202197 RepID=A0A2W4SCC4_9GAMM|nr:MAG: UDP-N-acetylmuramoylalanyl-D-glutamate--2,6-diaminopimelate ligase [Candidatus Methylumidiphilus alinenensis]